MVLITCTDTRAVGTSTFPEIQRSDVLKEPDLGTGFPEPCCSHSRAAPLDYILLSHCWEWDQTANQMRLPCTPPRLHTGPITNRVWGCTSDGTATILVWAPPPGPIPPPGWHTDSQPWEHQVWPGTPPDMLPQPQHYEPHESKMWRRKKGKQRKRPYLRPHLPHLLTRWSSCHHLIWWMTSENSRRYQSG